MSADDAEIVRLARAYGDAYRAAREASAAAGETWGDWREYPPELRNRLFVLSQAQVDANKTLLRALGVTP